MSGINKDASGNLTLKETLAGSGLVLTTEGNSQVLSVIPPNTTEFELLKRDVLTLKNTVEVLNRTISVQTQKINELQNK